MIDCKRCINSGCCKLKIEISKQEYESLSDVVKKEFTKHIDSFLEKNPHLKGLVENDLEILFNDNYAIMNKGIDGYCNLLNKKSMLCSVYEERPQTCKDYKNNKCQNFRLMDYEISN